MNKVTSYFEHFAEHGFRQVFLTQVDFENSGSFEPAPKFKFEVCAARARRAGIGVKGFH